MYHLYCIYSSLLEFSYVVNVFFLYNFNKISLFDYKDNYKNSFKEETDFATGVNKLVSLCETSATSLCLSCDERKYIDFFLCSLP